MKRRPSRLRRLAGRGLLVLAALAATTVRGQEQPATSYDEWRLLEPAEEMLAYRNQLREGPFDATSKTFLEKTALPQLGLPKNRPVIDRVRRRMREVLCGDAGGDPKATAQALQVVADFMTALARDGKADMVTRVNAALMVGELRGPGNKMWTPAVAPLTAMLGDDSLPPAVRIAAAAGLSRHVEADPEGRGADVGPAALALVGAPLAGVDPVAADWLRSRALSMLARMGSAAPNGTAAAAAKTLLDQARPIDVRVRAAAAAGRCIKAPGDTNVAAAATAIRELATAALTATKADADRRVLAVRLAGGEAGQPQQRPGLVPEGVGPPGDGDPGDAAQACRRDAWRLATLADALAAGDGGLAVVAGDAALQDLARAMREGAARLDQQPDTASLENAIGAIADAGKPDGAAGGPQEAGKAAERGEPAGVDGVPFGEQ